MLQSQHSWEANPSKLGAGVRDRPWEGGGSTPGGGHAGRKRNPAYVSHSPADCEKLIESIRSIRELDILVTPVKAEDQKPQELVSSLQGNNADMVLMCLPRVTPCSGNIPAAMGYRDVPVILFPVNLDLIMLEADMASTPCLPIRKSMRSSL